MEHRLAFTAGTLEQLQEKLAGYLGGQAQGGGIAECYVGEVKKNKEVLSGLNADEETQSLIQRWLQGGKYGKLLELWAKGLSFEWSRMYGPGGVYAGQRPRRLALPGYPFARERYWVEGVAAGAGQGAGMPASATAGIEPSRHPLVQRNTSKLEVQRFSSVLSGEEFFLTDHVVQGKKVLPAVCYLEMVRAAVVESLELPESSDAVVELQNVVWIEPVVVSGQRDVHIRLYREKDAQIGFEIYTGEAAEAGETEQVHARGHAKWVAGGSDAAEGPGWVDVEGLRTRSREALEVSRCYEAFGALGIEYGPSHRGLTSLGVGRDEAGEEFVLAQVQRPACVEQTAGQYVLHPSVLDAALQAAMGLGMGPGGASPGRGVLPFALESLQILGPTPEAGWVVVRPSAAAEAASS